MNDTTNTASALSPVSLLAVTCAAAAVDLAACNIERRREAGDNPLEWGDDCVASPEICCGLRQTLEAAHGLDHLPEFAAIFRQVVVTLAKARNIPTE